MQLNLLLLADKHLNSHLQNFQKYSEPKNCYSKIKLLCKLQKFKTSVDNDISFEPAEFGLCVICFDLFQTWLFL